MASSSSSNSTPALAFVWFPGAPYTQRAALSAAKAALEPQGWRIIHPSDDDEAPTNDEEAAAWIERNTTSTSSPRVALFMDYDLIPWQHVQSRNYCVSSYCIRKALIRKNWLHTSVHAYSVKAAASSPSPLALLPRSWSVELQFADDLDELLIDELYDLAEMLEAGGDGKKRWFILKAAMADRGMGIRIFSSLDGLRRILEEFEEQDTSDGEEENQEGESSSSAVALGQLRHFVIQVSWRGRRRGSGLSDDPSSLTTARSTSPHLYSSHHPQPRNSKPTRRHYSASSTSAPTSSA